MITLTIYSRPDCHLCDDMKAIVRRVASAWRERVAIVDTDISNDAELEARYGLEVPVLTVNGRKVAKYGITEQQLRRILEGTAAE